MEGSNCTYCQNPILVCRIRCAKCEDYDLCLQCFALGAESGQHKKEHDYHVFDTGCFTIFSNSSWTSGEEEQLLDALEHYGFGNWGDVANHVKTKTQEECKSHYFTYFIHGNIGKATFPTEHKNSKVFDHTCPDGGPLSPSLTTPLPPVELTIPEQQELGYMPLRDDFEKEYDNNAETLVSGLNINYDDDDLEIALKLSISDMYRYRLKERDRRKKVAREHNLLNAGTTTGTKKVQNNKKKLFKEDRDLQEKLRVFAQFHSASEQEKFFESLQKERRLKSRIKELMKYRRNGIVKLEEVTRYEAEKYRREKRKEKKKLISWMSNKRQSMGSRKDQEEKKEGENPDDITSDWEGNKTGVGGGIGTELLSDRERWLCNTLGLKPSSYITIKTCIIRDYLQRRQGIPVKIRYPSHLDKTHRRRILNFLSENGWLGGVSAV